MILSTRPSMPGAIFPVMVLRWSEVINADVACVRTGYLESHFWMLLLKYSAAQKRAVELDRKNVALAWLT